MCFLASQRRLNKISKIARKYVKWISKEKCTLQNVPIADKTAKYHSSQRKVSQFIAESAMPKRPQDEADTKILATNF